MVRVLLIEDNAVLRENTAELLELSNYIVTTAENGRIGVDLARLNLPDIIVCDIMMPELDGYGVLKELSLHEGTKYIPFIFLSAKVKRSDIRTGMDLGADDYITKPFNDQELISAMESRLAKTAILKEYSSLETTNSEDNHLTTIKDLKDYFKLNGTVYKYKKGDEIYTEGEHSNKIYLINRGAVKCFRFDDQGKELITAIYKEDDLFGYASLTQNLTYKEFANAILPTVLFGLNKDELISILNENHNVSMEFIRLLTEDLKVIKDHLLEMAYSSVQKKTATTILKFAEKLNCHPKEPIRISRNDLASVAGIATETLIRTMSTFKKQGIIEVEGRTIKILDLEKLHNI